MEEAHKQLAGEFARAVIARDFEAAGALFAPWLRETTPPERLRELVEEQLREMMQYAAVDELTYPVDFDVDGNSSTIDSLREPRSYAPDRPIPEEVTRENFRKWLCIQFLAGDDVDVDAWFDFWAAVVETDGRLALGYFEFAEPD
jgi:hypothetical protein